jgi:MFS family permease
MAATLPNLLFSPFAGTFVDRWDQKHVMVVSDLLRAGLVLLIPLAAQHSVLLSYPIVFGVTTVSIFFRPARSAVIPRIVATEDLTPANGAMWTAETIADVVGYPIAGIFVAFLGSALALAFWFDAASYVVSAALVLSLAIPPVVRSAAPMVAGSVRRFLAEVGAGWRFLRSEPALFQNTVISGLAQFAVGALVALPVVYARDVLQGSPIPYPQSYAALDLALGVGNLVGGIAIGAVGAGRRKGPFVIGGYVVLGLATMSLGLTGNEVLALTLTLFAGLANMAFIIPTQTLFAERTPQDLMGRVVGIRSSMVLGPMTIGIALSGILAQSMGAAAVFILFGLFTALAGAAGLLLPAVRET